MFQKLARAVILAASLILVTSRILSPSFSHKPRPSSQSDVFTVSQLQVRRS